MRLNVQTDYALRLLMALANRSENVVSVDAISKLHGVSRNHLAKVAQALVGLGYVEATRGRNGGLRLAKSADQIRVGDVVRAIENDLGVVECLQADNTSDCPLLPACRLKLVLHGATQQFLKHLDTVSLATLLPKSHQQSFD